MFPIYSNLILIFLSLPTQQLTDLSRPTAQSQLMPMNRVEVHWIFLLEMLMLIKTRVHLEP